MYMSEPLGEHVIYVNSNITCTAANDNIFLFPMLALNIQYLDLPWGSPINYAISTQRRTIECAECQPVSRYPLPGTAAFRKTYQKSFVHSRMYRKRPSCSTACLVQSDSLFVQSRNLVLLVPLGLSLVGVQQRVCQILLTSGVLSSTRSFTLFMDLSKCFDCMPHTLLMWKLDACGLTTNKCQLVCNYVTECNGQRSESVEVFWQALLKVYHRVVGWDLCCLIYLNDLFYFVLECKLCY